MNAMGAEEPDEQRTDRTDHVAGVLERAGHRQNARAQTSLEQMYPRVEEPTQIRTESYRIPRTRPRFHSRSP